MKGTQTLQHNFEECCGLLRLEGQGFGSVQACCNIPARDEITPSDLLLTAQLVKFTVLLLYFPVDYTILY